MLTTFGRFLATGVIAVLLLAPASYLFLFSAIGPDLICQHRASCVVATH